MTKHEIVKGVSEKVNLLDKDIESVINETLNQIIEAVSSGEKVIFKHFGVWESHKRQARIGVNPRTLKKMTIPEKITPSFRAGKLFCEKVNTYN